MNQNKHPLFIKADADTDKQRNKIRELQIELAERRADIEDQYTGAVITVIREAYGEPNLRVGGARAVARSIISGVMVDPKRDID
jgi:hypothetical protein